MRGQTPAFMPLILPATVADGLWTIYSSWSLSTRRSSGDASAGVSWWLKRGIHGSVSPLRADSNSKAYKAVLDKFGLVERRSATSAIIQASNAIDRAQETLASDG